MNIEGVKTVEELKEHQKKVLLEGKVNDVEREYYGKIVDMIVAASKVSIAQAIIDNEAAQRHEQLKKQIEQNGLTLQQYLEITGQKEEELLAKGKEEAKANLTRYLVLEKISAVEHLGVSDAELDVEIAKLAEKYSMKVEDVRKALGNLENFRDQLHQNKLHEFLIKNNH